MSVPKDVRTASFRGSVRGYDRAEVDAYVVRVNALIAELEIKSSPRAAVRHALEQVGEQTSAILQRARETAEEITATARREADGTTAHAKAEAAEIVLNAESEGEKARAEATHVIAEANAKAEEIRAKARAEGEKLLVRTREEIAALQDESEARLRDLHADIATTWKERRELLDDVRGIATELEEAASRAAARVPPPSPDEADEETEPEAEPTQVLAAEPSDES